MTTAPTHTSSKTLDLSSTSAVPVTRLVKVELRKMVDTRSGLWLIIAIVFVTAAITLIFMFAAEEQDRVFLNFIGVLATPQSFLLPVLGILLVTQEWTQRTGMVTFTLEPHRSKVITAKVVAALVLGLLAVVLAIALAALGTALAGAPDPWAGIGSDDFAKFTLLQVIGVLQGLAYGLIFLNSAAAIVTFFVLPLASSIVFSIWTAVRDTQPWVDPSTAQTPLFEGVDVTGEQWAQLAVTTAIWVLLPFLAGLWRVLRAELK
jgi:ABC-type transport system involved in multi-copper enzyme maturation permease subunit